jgi:hypothetical protein
MARGHKRKKGMGGVVSARDAAVQFLETLRNEPSNGIMQTWSEGPGDEEEMKQESLCPN